MEQTLRFIIRNMSFKKRLLAGFSVTLAGLVLLAFTVIATAVTVRSAAQRTSSTSMKYAILAKDMQLNVIQVQQWLTDISATKAQSGLDDGFAEAQSHAARFNIQLKELRNHFLESNNHTEIARLDSMGVHFEKYYKTGITMANQYIQKGTAAGNAYMAIFDPAAAILAKDVEHNVVQMNDVLNRDMGMIVKNSYRLIFISIALGTLFLLLGGSLSIITINSIMSPIQETTDMLHNIAEGEGDLTRRLDDSHTHELGILARFFNLFIDHIHTIIKKIRTESSTLSSTASELASMAVQIASNTEETSIQSSLVSHSASEISTKTVRVVNNVESIKTLAGNAATDIVSIEQDMEHITRDVALGEEQLQHVAQSSGSVVNRLTRINQETQKTVTIADIAVTKVYESQTSVTNLIEATGRIKQVVDMITDIADQTKLLALNATIEAARAGESGKGFAVVASEVKNLANQTMLSTVSIKSLIDAITEGTAGTVHNMKEIEDSIQSVQEMISTVSGSLNEQTETVRQNSEQINSVSVRFQETKNAAISTNENIKSISNRITAMQQNIFEVTGHFNEISSSVNEISGNIQGISTASSETNSVVAEIERKTANLAEMSANLNGQVQKFKV